MPANPKQRASEGDKDTVDEQPETSQSLDTSAPEGSAAHPCANCGKPGVWRTTNPGADQLFFCDKDRPPEGVERIDG